MHSDGVVNVEENHISLENSTSKEEFGSKINIKERKSCIIFEHLLAYRAPLNGREVRILRIMIHREIELLS